MSAPARTWAWIAAITLVAGVVALRAPLGFDYERTGKIVDAAAPQIDALVRGDLDTFTSDQAPQGPVSLVLRAPFAAIASAQDQHGRYRLGVFPCLLILGLAAYWLLAGLARPWWQKAIALAAVMVSPVSLAVVRWGHPEDLLATGLLVAGLTAGSGGMAVAAGVLAGLALATKAWAVLGVLAIVIAARQEWLKVAAIALAVAVVLTAPLAVADPTSFRTAVKSANTAPLVHPADIWWTLSQREITVDEGAGAHVVRAPHVPNSVEHAVRPLMVALAAAVLLLLARRRPGMAELLLALALVFLVRCVLDPGDNWYYHAPFLIFIAMWEATAHERVPWITLVATALTATVPGLIGSHRDLANLTYLLWALPAIVIMVVTLFGRNRPVFVLADKRS